MTLKAHEVFELKKFIESVDKNNLVNYDDSKYKAIANRQNIKRALSNQNEEYEEDYKSLAESYIDIQQDIQEFQQEMTEQQQETDKEELSSKEVAEKRKDLQEEWSDFMDKQDERLNEVTEEHGFEDTDFTTEETEQGTQQRIIAERDEEVEIEFAEGYKERSEEWLRDMVRELGPDYLREKDLISIGEELGIEE